VKVQDRHRRARHPQPVEEAEIILHLVAFEDVAGQRYGQGEEHPPAVGGVPRPLRNPREEGDQGGVERILEEQRPVEPEPPKFRSQPETADSPLVAPGPLVDHHLVQVRMMAEQFGHRRLGEKDDPCSRERGAHARQGGGGHHRVAQPVRRPYQQRRR